MNILKDKIMKDIIYIFFSISLLFPVSIIKINGINIPLFYFFSY